MFKKYIILILIIITLAVSQLLSFSFDKTSETEFCVSCHSMDSAYQDYKKSIHFKNAHGISVECKDCHIDTASKLSYLKAKIGGLKDIWSEVTGKINTAERYEDHKLEMAETVWAQMRKNDSSTCRSCHDVDKMDPSLQSPESKTAHLSAQSSNQTCIDCHLGIAHSLPTPKQPKFTSILELNIGDMVYVNDIVKLSNTDQLEKSRAKLLPLTQIKIIEINQQNKAIKVGLTGWKEGRKQLLYTEKGLRIAGAVIRNLKEFKETGEEFIDPKTDTHWKSIQVQGWISDTLTTNDLSLIWKKYAFFYTAKCANCHMKVSESHHTANEWPAQFKGMSQRSKLSKIDSLAMLKYLQFHSADFIQH